MSKGQLHFNEITGRLEKCNAIKGKCPFGEENHFNSLKEAQEYADKKNELKAKAEREIEESGAREIIDQTVQNIRYTERLLLKDNLTTKDLSEAHYNMVIARYNLDRSEDYTAMVDKKYFADPDVRDEAIEELEIERAKGAKELDKVYKDITKDFIKNFNDLPVGTKVEFKNKVQSEKIGEQEVILTIVYPDGSSEEVKSILKVENSKKDVSNNQIRTDYKSKNNTKTDYKSGTNAKTGVESVAGIAGILAAATTGYALTKKKEEE